MSFCCITLNKKTKNSWKIRCTSMPEMGLWASQMARGYFLFCPLQNESSLQETGDVPALKLLQSRISLKATNEGCVKSQETDGVTPWILKVPHLFSIINILLVFRINKASVSKKLLPSERLEGLAHARARVTRKWWSASDWISFFVQSSTHR